MTSLLYFTPVVLYLATVVGVTLAVRSRSDDESFFFASRRLGTVQALMSVVSSETSVATTVVFPAAGLAGGYVLVWLLLGYICGRILVAAYYLRPLYMSDRLTIYQTMSSHHHVLESAYLLAKYLSGGARFFLGSYALSQLLGGPILMWAVVVALCVAAYSLTGGMKAIVVMDQVQSVLIVGTGVFLCLFLARNLGTREIAAPSFFDWSPGHATFSPILFIAGTVLSIGSHGADQDLLLRILSTRTLAQARRSLALSGVGAAILIGIYLTVGYLLRTVAFPGMDEKSPLAGFVTASNLPFLQGMFLVLLAAAAMSSLDSTIHSTGAIWKSLVGSKRPGRVWSTFSLFVMLGFASLFYAIHGRHQDFLSLVMGSMNYVNGGLIGIFTVFTFFRQRLTGPGVVAGLAVGFMTTTVCEWAFENPVPWTYTVLLSSSLAFIAALGAGATASRAIKR